MILQGEIWCWPLLGFKGLSSVHTWYPGTAPEYGTRWALTWTHPSFKTRARCGRFVLGHNRALKQGRRRRSNRFIFAKQQLRTCMALFCTFLSRRCTTSTWKCLISRFVEDSYTRKQLSFSFPELWYSPLEFNSKKNWQHLTNETRWNKGEKVWGSANSLSDVFVAVAVLVA